MIDASNPPKLFISYSWTSPEHKMWVLELAENLMACGVDPQMDAWNIEPGDDSMAFMKRMVTDPTIRKVLMVVDKNYAEKANAGQGGVGIETRFVEKAIFDKDKQDKFVALVLEKDENGDLYLPDYYKKRIYIDFSESQNIEGEYQKLLRWIFGIPEYKKPPIGNPPAFLFNKESDDTPTITPLIHKLEAIKSTGKNVSKKVVKRYIMTSRDGDSWAIYRDNANKWRWLRTAPNGRIKGASLEGYVNKSDCITNARKNGMRCRPT